MTRRPRRQDRRTGSALGWAICLLVAVGALLGPLGPATAYADSLQLVGLTALPDKAVSMTVGVPAGLAGTMHPQNAWTVRADGRPLPATVTRTASAALSLAFVIDNNASQPPDQFKASVDGARALIGRLPAGARTTVVTSAGRPHVVSGRSSDSAQTLRALAGVVAEPGDALPQALRLAAKELDHGVGGPRTIVAFTGAGPGTPEAARALALQLAPSAALLYVVSPAADEDWNRVVGLTGGAVLVGPPAEDVALATSIARSLDTLYHLRFTLPRPVGVQVSVRLDAGGVQAETAVRLNGTTAGRSPAFVPVATGAGALVFIVMLGLLAVLVTGQRRSPRPAEPMPRPSPQPSPRRREGSGAHRGADTSSHEPAAIYPGDEPKPAPKPPTQAQPELPAQPSVQVRPEPPADPIGLIPVQAPGGRVRAVRDAVAALAAADRQQEPDHNPAQAAVERLRASWPAHAPAPGRLARRLSVALAGIDDARRLGEVSADEATTRLVALLQSVDRFWEEAASLPAADTPEVSELFDALVSSPVRPVRTLQASQLLVLVDQHCAGVEQALTRAYDESQRLRAQFHELWASPAADPGGGEDAGGLEDVVAGVDGYFSLRLSDAQASSERMQERIGELVRSWRISADTASPVSADA